MSNVGRLVNLGVVVSEVQDSSCPLCRSAAQVQHHVLKHSSHYVCRSCGELVVKQRAERWISDASAQVRQSLMEAARMAPADKVFFISYSPVGDPAPTGRGECLTPAEALDR